LRADEDDGDAKSSIFSAGPAWREISAGAEVSRHSWSAYSGTTFAPFGSLAEDGVRFRTSGGYGRYRYTKDGSDKTYRGTTSFSDILVGFQAQSGSATFKLFAGASAISHAIAPFDRDNVVTGLDIGFKGALEIWLELGDPWWTALDLSATSAHDTYSGRWRLGWRVMPELSLGVEAGVHGNTSFDGGRGALFVRWAPGWGELSLSGGLTGDLHRPDTPYASVNMLIKF
jgi:hypothetical protein